MGGHCGRKLKHPDAPNLKEPRWWACKCPSLSPCWPSPTCTFLTGFTVVLFHPHSLYLSTVPRDQREVTSANLLLTLVEKEGDVVAAAFGRKWRRHGSCCLWNKSDDFSFVKYEDNPLPTSSPISSKGNTVFFSPFLWKIEKLIQRQVLTWKT